MYKKLIFLSIFSLLFNMQTYAKNIGEYIDDSTLHTKIWRILNKYDSLSDVYVHVYKRNVMICGFIDNSNIEEKFLREIQQVDGVKKVYNHFKVKNKEATQRKLLGEKVDESLLTASVKNKLFLTRDIPAHRLTVLSDAHTVYVCGFVPDKRVASKVVNLLESEKQHNKLVNYEAALIPVA